MPRQDVHPVTTQKLGPSPVAQQERGPTVDEQLETLSAALETALDVDAKPKERADMLTRIRDARAKRDTSSGTTP